MKKTFKGGIVLSEFGLGNEKKTVRMPRQKTVRISMHQHIGEESCPTVKPGDEVKVGQTIGIPASFGLSVHSSVSGKVSAVGKFDTPKGICTCVEIENDFKDTPDESVKPFPKKISSASGEELISFIRDKGIAELDGSGFPTYKKLENAVGKTKHIVISCTENEPRVSVAGRLVKEQADKIISGAKVLSRIFPEADVTFAFDFANESTAKEFHDKLDGIANFRAVFLQMKYPQSDEKLIVSALSGKDVPEGKSPSDIGYAVFGAETVKAICDAFVFGLPLIEKTLTVTGSAVGEEMNVVIPLGTLLSDVINFCGGLRKSPDIIVYGGAMTGIGIDSLNMPVIKTASCLIVGSIVPAVHKKANCIRCGRCITVCPMRLMPLYLSDYSVKKMGHDLIKFGIKNCSECGACNYICPAKVDILQNIRSGKAFLLEMNRSME